jgi:recombination protein RecA
MFTPDLHGINRWSDVLDLAVEHDVVKKAGAFFSYGDLRLGQGKRNASTYLQENNDLFEDIDNQVRQITGITKSTEELANTPLTNPSVPDLDSPDLVAEEASALINSTD